VVKTSTGKDGPGASLPAVLTMLEVAREVGDRTGRVTGVKASGGIRTTEEALAYLALVTATVGESWLVPDRFRFGASSLLAALVADRR
jgi:deoxyribose-phosphate aldolase